MDGRMLKIREIFNEPLTDWYKGEMVNKKKIKHESQHQYGSTTTHNIDRVLCLFPCEASDYFF